MGGIFLCPEKQQVLLLISSLQNPTSITDNNQENNIIQYLQLQPILVNHLWREAAEWSRKYGVTEIWAII
jgi:hypothetical protein